MHQSEFVIVARSSVESSHRTVFLVSISPLTDLISGPANIQVEGLPDTSNPGHSQQAELLITCTINAHGLMAVLNCLFEHVRLGYLHEGWVNEWTFSAGRSGLGSGLGSEPE